MQTEVTDEFRGKDEPGSNPFPDAADQAEY